MASLMAQMGGAGGAGGMPGMEGLMGGAGGAGGAGGPPGGMDFAKLMVCRSCSFLASLFTFVR